MTGAEGVGGGIGSVYLMGTEFLFRKVKNMGEER